jgi:NADH:ubiquinone oxidoreductase subunit C
MHLRLSTLFSSAQLVDLFSYELPLAEVRQGSHAAQSILVYNFHHLHCHDRFFLFCIDPVDIEGGWSVNSIRELYPNTWWLEREVAELHGYVFNNKKDLRNLMLQYGDTSAPFRKAYPSIGVREVFYDSVSDHLAQRVVTAQM